MVSPTRRRHTLHTALVSTLVAFIVGLAAPALGVELELAFVSTQPSDEACVPGQPVAGFLPSQPRGWLYLLVAEARLGDRLETRFVAPDGSIGKAIRYEALDSNGSYCFDAALDIHGTTAAGQPGAWKVLGLWNDEALFTVDFQVWTASGEPPGCRATLAPSRVVRPPDGGGARAVVLTPSGCAWQATSTAPWLILTEGNTGFGGARVLEYEVEPNITGLWREGRVRALETEHVVEQPPLTPAPCTYTLAPASAQFPAAGGEGAVVVTTQPSCAWTASTSAAWITLTAGASGTGSGTVRYQVAAHASAAARAGSILAGGQTATIAQAGADAPPPLGAPTISSGGVVNAADYSAAVSPGMILAIFGLRLAPEVQAARATPLPVTLAGMTVEVIDGARTLLAPLYFVSPGQANAQLPFETAGARVQVRVRNAAGVSNSEWIDVVASSPRLLTKTQDGRGEAVVVKTDYSVVGPNNPARAGEYLTVFLLGLGDVDPPLVSGRPAGDGGPDNPLNILSGRVEATLGSTELRVLWAGLSPYFVGLYQVNVQMPEVLLPGGYELRIGVGEEVSQVGVSVAVASDFRPVGGGVLTSGAGKLTAGGLELGWGAGVVAGGPAVTVYRHEGPSPGRGLEGKRVSEVFALDGLPEQTAGEMAVSLPVSRTGPSQGSTFLVVETGARGGRGLAMLPARVENGRVLATLPALAPPWPEEDGTSALRPSGVWQTASGSRDTFTMWAISGYLALESPSGRFRITYPVIELALGGAEQIAEALDAAHPKIAALGLDWNRRNGIHAWPIEIDIYPFTGDRADRWGEEGSRAFGVQRMGINLNATFLEKRENWEYMRITAGHELLHLMQALYNPAGALTPWLWFEEASATWLERRLTSIPEYVPPTVRPSATINPLARSDNYAFLSRGLEQPVVNRGWISNRNGNAEFVQNHGYGASLFLEHLTNSRGDRLIGSLTQAMSLRAPGVFRSASRYSPVEAIRNLVSNVPAEWQDFCEAFMARDIFKGRPRFPEINEILGMREATHVWRDANAGSHTFRMNKVRDLSARVFTVQFDSNLGWPAGTALRVRLVDSSGESLAIVYRAKIENRVGVLWEKIGATRADLEAPNADRLVANNESLAILVVNLRAVPPYTGQRTFELQVERVQPAQSLPIHATVGVVADVIGEHYVTSGAQPRLYSEAGMSFRTPTTRFGSCSEKTVWNGTSFDFSGTCEASGGATVEFSMKGEVAGDLSRLVSGSFRSKETSRFGLTVTEIAYDLSDIPAAGTTGAGPCRTYNFRAYREQAGGRVSNVQYLRRYLATDGSERQRDSYVRTEWGKYDVIAPEVRVSFVCQLP